MKNHSKPLPEDKVSEGKKPYRSLYKGEGYGFETLEPKGAVELHSTTAPQPLLADARRGSGTADAPEAIKVLLDFETSEILTDIGAEAFIVVARSSHPDPGGRMTIHAVPCSIKAANSAVAVARGELLTRKPRAPK